MKILVFLLVILRDYVIIYSDPATLLEKASLTNICFGILELFFWKVNTDTQVALKNLVKLIEVEVHFGACKPSTSSKMDSVR